VVTRRKSKSPPSRQKREKGGDFDFRRVTTQISHAKKPCHPESRVLCGAKDLDLLGCGPMSVQNHSS